MRDERPKGGALFIELMRHDKEKRSDGDEEKSSKLAGIASEIAESLGVDLDDDKARALAASLKSFVKACGGYE